MAMEGDTLYAPAHNMRPRRALVCWSWLGLMPPWPKPLHKGSLRLSWSMGYVQTSLEMPFLYKKEDVNVRRWGILFMFFPLLLVRGNYEQVVQESASEYGVLPVDGSSPSRRTKVRTLPCYTAVNL